MGLIGDIKKRFLRSGDTTQTTQTDTGASSIPYSPRIDVNELFAPESRAMSVATVYACVNIIADAVANLPFQYLRQKDGIFVEDSGNVLNYLLNVQPCLHLSAFDFWHNVISYILLKGNAYIVPEYSMVTMELERLALVNPDCVNHDILKDTYTIYDTNAGVMGTFQEDDIIHIKNDHCSNGGKIGLSTLHFARRATDIALTGDNETLDRFRNGGSVRGIVSNDNSTRGFGEYQDEQLKKAATDIDGRFRAGERIVNMPGETQWNAISLSSADMQFLESRKFSVLDICRFFRVPPSFVFADTNSNYKTAEMANVAFLSQTLNPILRKIEIEFLRKLIAPSLFTKRRFQFNRQGLYACDLDSRVKYQTATIAAGIYTVNEWRQAENKPSVDGGDKVLVSANLKGINDVPAVVATKKE